MDSHTSISSLYSLVGMLHLLRITLSPPPPACSPFLSPPTAKLAEGLLMVGKQPEQTQLLMFLVSCSWIPCLQHDTREPCQDWPLPGWLGSTKIAGRGKKYKSKKIKQSNETESLRDWRKRAKNLRQITIKCTTVCCTVLLRNATSTSEKTILNKKLHFW